MIISDSMKTKDHADDEGLVTVFAKDAILPYEYLLMSSSSRSFSF